MQDPKETILLQRDVPSNREELRELPSLLEGIRSSYSISDDQFYNLVIAMTEAVNNAITHGNKLDETKRVRYTLQSVEGGIFCTVEDEGEGFDPETLADPVSPENLLRDGGRGIFIIRALMRDVQAQHIGSGMRLTFICPPD